MSIFTIDGVTLNTQHFPSVTIAPPHPIPILALHGWGGNIASMQGVGERLAQLGYHVYAVDFPGFGQSSLPPTAWGVPEYAQCILSFLDQAKLDRVHLIGHSFGGRVSIVLGAEHPERIEKIVLAASAGVLAPPSASTQARQAIAKTGKALLNLPGLGGLEKQAKQWYESRYASEDYRNAGPLRETFRKVVNEDLVPRAARIKASTLLVWGDLDDATPLWQGQTLEKTIPDGGLVVFRGAGHFAYQERLPDFIRIVDTFLKG
jgi:pimeloyl-ACP methyl ester carboxylesterase